MAASVKRWQEWMDAERPEDETLPGEMKAFWQSFDPILICSRITNFKKFQRIQTAHFLSPLAPY